MTEKKKPDRYYAWGVIFRLTGIGVNVGSSQTETFLLAVNPFIRPSSNLRRDYSIITANVHDEKGVSSRRVACTR